MRYFILAFLLLGFQPMLSQRFPNKSLVQQEPLMKTEITNLAIPLEK